MFAQTERVLAPIPIVDGEVLFSREFYGESDADRYFESLLTGTPWRAEEIAVWGRRSLQPRLIAWFGDQNAHYKYSGLVVRPNPWTPLLLELRGHVEASSGATYNSVLLNLYRNERDRMGWHSDDEPELGRNPTIASISFGEERTFKLRHKLGKYKDVRIDLPHGSLLVMKGVLQHHWKHAIDRETASKGPRVNLTFRYVKTPAPVA